MNRTRILLLLVVVIATASPVLSYGETGFLGNHHDSPVYYELYPDYQFMMMNRELLHKNKLKLRHFPVVDVTDWDWRRGGYDDMSWWIQLEELRFLLPLIESNRQEDRVLAGKWIRSWHQSDSGNGEVNMARWAYPMSAAYRGLVLVYYLKTEEQRDEPDTELITLLRDELLKHQKFLADPDHFNANSNHGLVESFSLLEITRTFPDTAYEELGLDRMIAIAGVSVSGRGMHMEHASAYSLAFTTWIDGFSSYLSGQDHLNRDKVAALVEYARRLRETSWYMFDHDGTVPEIGDTDSMNVFARYPDFRKSDGAAIAPAIFDPEAGYAVYKDSNRYVLFTIQNKAHDLNKHFHNDALAVYYRYKGETILGDPGKYEYTWTRTRHHFTSMSSHNTIVPTGKEGLGVGTLLATSTGFETTDKTCFFTASLEHKNEFVIHRTVVLPLHGKSLEVIDSLDTVESTDSSQQKGVSQNKASDKNNPGIAMGRERARARPVTKQTTRPGETKSPQPRNQNRRVTAVWNFGYDVAAVNEADPAVGEAAAYTLETKRGRKIRFSITLDADSCMIPVLSPDLVRGRVSPLAGWYAPKMYTKRPSYTLLVNMELEGPLVMITRLLPVEKKYFPGLRILLKGY